MTIFQTSDCQNCPINVARDKSIVYRATIMVGLGM